MDGFNYCDEYYKCSFFPNLPGTNFAAYKCNEFMHQIYPEQHQRPPKN
jgi:hypothetical protein